MAIGYVEVTTPSYTGQGENIALRKVIEYIGSKNLKFIDGKVKDLQDNCELSCENCNKRGRVFKCSRFSRGLSYIQKRTKKKGFKSAMRKCVNPSGYRRVNGVYVRVWNLHRQKVAVFFYALRRLIHEIKAPQDIQLLLDVAWKKIQLEGCSNNNKEIISWPWIIGLNEKLRTRADSPKNLRALAHISDVLDEIK